LAKLGDFKTPTGVSGNILNPMDLISVILGAFVLIIAFATGQKLANGVGSKIPLVDSGIEQPWSSPQPVMQGKGRNII
jgi:hypothetical protein